MSLQITFVTEAWRPEVNGVAMTVGHLVDGLRGRGHQVNLVRPRQHRQEVADATEILLPGLPLPGYAGLRLGLPAGRALRRQWRQQRPDLVHVVTEGPLGWSAVNVARQLGIPVTSAFHTNFDHYSVHYGVGWLRPAVSAYLRSLHRRTRATMVPTEALAATLAGEGIAGVHVVGRGVDTTLFDPQRRAPELRRAWGAEGDALVCLYVGRLAPEKNLALVCKAFSAIAAVRPDARMVWVGDGPAAEELRKAYPEQHFAGTQIGENLARHYASADLFLFPSLSETYGNVVAEAMASALPVLAYRSAAAAELIVDGQNGRVVAAGNESAYLGAAQALSQRDANLRALGEAARQSMRLRNWASVIDRFESVVQEAIGA